MPDLLLFLVALTAAYLIPGPDMLVLLQTGAAQGRSRAFATAGGLALARSVHVLLAGLGLATLARTAPLAFEAIRWVGAAYLVFVGVQILRSGALEHAATHGPAARRLSHAACFRRGLLTNLLNPKALIFCSVLLPQFVVSGGAPPAVQLAVLGVMLVATGLAFDLVFAAGGEGIGRWLAHRPLVQRVQRWLFGSLLIGLGVRLALSPLRR